MMRARWGSVKELLNLVPDDGVLFVFNGQEQSWRSAAGIMFAGILSIRIMDRLPKFPGVKQIRSQRRDLAIYKKKQPSGRVVAKAA